jgi:predicted DNA-binding protein YlxM (UPF0122 family)
MENPYKISSTTGTIPDDKIPGKEKEIRKLMSLLEAQSVVVEAMRRMGKTLLLRKLAYKSKDSNNKMMYFFLQGVKDLPELSDLLFSELRKEQSFGKHMIFDGIRRLYDTLKPEEVKLEIISFKLPQWKSRWKEVFSTLLKDLANRNNEKDEILTLILDEFPVMIWDWIQDGKANEALEFLDVLRQQRQTLEAKGKIRFIICGSIGLQVVLKHLKMKYNYMGEPFNETEMFPMEAMNQEDAIFLCRCLYLNDFRCENKEVLEENFAQIVKLTDGLPFYINKLFTVLQQNFNGVLSSENIENAFKELMTLPQHFNTFKHLHDRLTIYYPETESKNMLLIINYLSKQNESKEESEIISGIDSNTELIKEALMTLVSEHYLLRTFNDDTRVYSFKYQLIKKWWKINKA